METFLFGMIAGAFALAVIVAFLVFLAVRAGTRKIQRAHTLLGVVSPPTTLYGDAAAAYGRELLKDSGIEDVDAYIETLRMEEK